MKAFKQLDFSTENKIVFSYAGILCILGFFILLSPVFAQDDSIQSNQPKVHIDVNFQFPEYPGLFDYNIPLNDSLGISFHDFDEMQKYFKDKFDFKSMMPDEEFLKKYDQQQDEFLERYRKYQEESQKLIEKYFGRPLPGTDTIPGFERNRYGPDSKESNPVKHSKI